MGSYYADPDLTSLVQFCISTVSELCLSIVLLNHCIPAYIILCSILVSFNLYINLGSWCSRDTRTECSNVRSLTIREEWGMPEMEPGARELQEMHNWLLRRRRGGRILSDGVGVVRMPVPRTRPFFKNCTMPRAAVHHSLHHEVRAYQATGLYLNLRSR